MDLILACSVKEFKRGIIRCGIGKDSKLPWDCKEELEHFRNITDGHVVIAGRKTYDSLPSLKNRIKYCLSRKGMSIRDLLDYCKTYHKKKRVFIIGGGEIYTHMLNNLSELISKIHISIMHEQYDCDTFIELDTTRVVIEKTEKRDSFDYYQLSIDSQENQYLRISEQLLEKPHRETRNAITRAGFNYTMSFDLEGGFPLLTTKKTFFRGIVGEFIMFINGRTDTKELKENKIFIWEKNTNREFLDSNGFVDRKEGMMGPMYGYQWRTYNSDYNEETGLPKNTGFDQLRYVVETIKKDPTSRRIIMTTFNPLQADQGVLFPCHSLITQFFVEEKELSMTCYNRSQDIFLGVPFNIASSALLLSVVAKLTGYKPKFLHITLGDTHLYKTHEEQIKVQLERIPYKFPSLQISAPLSDISELSSLKIEDFSLENYVYHPSIGAEMVA